MGLTQKLGTIPLAIQTDSSNNVGIGLTPNTWFSGYKVLEMGSGSLVFPNNTTNTQLWNNLFINAAGNPTYKSNGIGGMFSLGGGGNAAVWYTAPSGTAGTTATLTQAMTLTNTGNVGIGVIPATFNTIGPVLQMGRAVFYGYNNEAALGANFRYESGDKYINSDFGCLYQMKNGTHVFSTAPSGTAGASMALTARMIIAENGSVTINTTSNNPIACNSTTNQYLLINSTGTNEAMTEYRNPTAESWYTGIRGAAGLAGITGYHIYSSIYGNDVMGLYANGNYDFAGSDVSDRRLKENIEAISYNALEKINALEACSYNMINNPNVKRHGFIAQEVQKVLPDLINGQEKEDEYLGLDYNGLLAIAIKAIQELTAKVTALEQKA